MKDLHITFIRFTDENGKKRIYTLHENRKRRKQTKPVKEDSNSDGIVESEVWN